MISTLDFLFNKHILRNGHSCGPKVGRYRELPLYCGFMSLFPDPCFRDYCRRLMIQSNSRRYIIVIRLMNVLLSNSGLRTIAEGTDDKESDIEFV